MTGCTPNTFFFFTLFRPFCDAVFVYRELFKTFFVVTAVNVATFSCDNKVFWSFHVYWDLSALFKFVKLQGRINKELLLLFSWQPFHYDSVHSHKGAVP